MKQAAILKGNRLQPYPPTKLLCGAPGWSTSHSMQVQLIYNHFILQEKVCGKKVVKYVWQKSGTYVVKKFSFVVNKLLHL